MLPDTIIAVNEKTDVAAARRAALELARLPDDRAGALSLLVTEAATNILKHAGSGHIVVRRIGDAEVEMIALDKGPGLANPARSFEDGYSTAGSPGTGLGAISRLSSFCDYYSAPDQGLVLVARIGTASSTDPPHEDLGAIAVSYPGETISGDCWAVSFQGKRFLLMVADGLGHGILASEASDAALEAFQAFPDRGPEDILERCHMRMRATRGAAVSIADADFAAGAVTFAGVGNVAGAIVPDAEQRRQMVSINGTVGHEMRRLHPYKYPLPSDALLILHSDGLSANWGLDKYPGLFHRHPSVIAGVLFRDFRRQRDDATIIVIRGPQPPRDR